MVAVADLPVVYERGRALVDVGVAQEYNDPPITATARIN